MPYPLKLRPHYRHAEQTPWGGQMLRDIFGKNIPDERTGESLEASTLPGMESIVENGPFAGETLGDLVDRWGEALTGPGVAGFPLLIKLLDARETLSVQVHPGDEYAKTHEGKLGKSEAWVVLFAPRGAKIVYGVDLKGEPLGQYVVDGRIEEALHWLPVAPGDVLYIPSGLVHALAGGIVAYEVQQSSDVTYRFWDWARTDKDGNLRALHTRKALDVTKCDLRPEKLEGATFLTEGGSITAYICEEHFELTRLNVAGSMPLPEGRMLILTALGDCALSWTEGEFSLRAGETALVPAALKGARLTGRLPVLCAATPNPESLQKALGYRAEAVAGLNAR